MSQSLRTITDNKLISQPSLTNSVTETNLERGQIFLFTPGNEKGGTFSFCWNPPASGTAIIEVWGASGSGGMMCCCGGGLPGNPGAYSKKQITVTASCFVCGTVGQSCGSPIICYRGRSEFTGVCWTGSGTNGCICAEGGIGGTSCCSPTTGMYCCFVASSFCHTLFGSSCGIICNFGSGAPAGCCAQAYGGDTNCNGGFSCASFRASSPSQNCCFIYHVKTSAGIFGKNGAVITYNVEDDTGQSKGPGQGIHSFSAAISGASRSPIGGVPFTTCYAGPVACGCYESHGCYLLMPAGVPGLPAHPCSNVRDHGIRGGNGAVRIRFF